MPARSSSAEPMNLFTRPRPFALIFILAARSALAQMAPDGGVEPAPPPSFIAKKKTLSGADLAKKREGVFVTGLPFFTSDPLNGAGAGATGYIHFNGTRDDPFFAYAPYKARLGLTLQYTTGNAGAAAIKLDMPFIAQTAWRLRLDLKYENTPNNQYFGLTEDTLAPLPFGRYSDYAAQRSIIRAGREGEPPEVADVYRHTFLEREWMFNAKGERVLFGGSWRLLVGYELQHMTYRTFEGEPVSAVDPVTGEKRTVPNGESLLREDANAGRVFGIEGGIVSLLQLSLMYDTRDFEPDPSSGVFLELGNEYSSALVGSQVEFNKLLFQARHYQQLLPAIFTRTVLATRFGYGTILGARAPFFEYQDQWSAEGSIKALGGSQTLRGFKANRFLGRTVAFLNVELRHRLWETNFIGQNFTFTLAPFVDLGAIGDAPFAIQPAVRAAYGGSLRIGWNQSTVITVDVGASAEDLQLFIGFNTSY